MSECIFLDEGKEGICLLGLFDDPMRFSFCHRERLEACPLRTWDVGGRRTVLEARRALLHGEGRRPRNVYQHLRLKALGQVEALLPGGWSPEGGRESPFSGDIPEPIPSRLWPRIRAMVLERDGEVCQECGADLSGRPNWMKEVHHIVPRVEGGSDHPHNLMTLCNECHRRHTHALMLSRTVDPEEAALRRKFGGGRELFISLIGL